MGGQEETLTERLEFIISLYKERGMPVPPYRIMELLTDVARVVDKLADHAGVSRHD
jgi:hypothetical protein